MTKVRLGIIGLGNIGQHHAAYLEAGKVNHCELVAVCNPSPARLEPFKSLATFSDAHQLIRSGLVDAVLIATPHFQHTTLGIDALSHGLHVMVEKPISAHKADAQRLIAAHQAHPKLVFAGMFQLRAEPRYLKIRDLLQSGALGQIVRVSWIMTDWYRTEAYYASGGWRATWKGEGGGVLLNQCLHNLDMLQWLLGLPAKVRGFCQLGRFHQIEVEDQVTAWLEYPNQATGTFVSSTGEAPGTNRFELVGSLGKLVLENDRLQFTRNDSDMLKFSKSAQTGFSRPCCHQTEIPIESTENPHAVLLQNFVYAILNGEPLIAPGAEGLHSVELANAILYSSLLDRTIDLPLDAGAYQRKLEDLIMHSRLEKKTVPTASEDFTRSFRK
ncbi:MAG TPA: Gfo/Idh/MocA family oxidoreductase [Clostridia bacterium]|nr:Gfo/Idh/MocA family oxidoreductase [Clostridia bacterium]